VPAATRNV
jgi:hypothetical protein